ncbi:hypothetical protein G8764_02525 [Pseudomaricurvus alcaniphilus]|uniref:hypothetical protein n=1 Tax=Pseudomaricurvus alcaniphilus TaxID=1166482 RepID=UPI0014086B4B|nr:hypothetical protein [Pseudomaricurvus alcaniphilus]NHN36164.1 hypothetical protein [Pseudomaricurvus alcaniphilus]
MVNGQAIIIVGINRSGTSAIAASLDAIGISLGEHSHKPIFEDTELAKCFRSRNWRGFEEIVADYASRHKLFAWKLPDAVNDLNRVDKLFRAKKYIFVFRDIYAIALRKEQALDQDVLQSMIKSNKQYQQVLNFIARSNIDYMLVSYEKMLIEPAVYANNLLNFLGLDKSEANLEKIVGSISASPADYVAWSAQAKQEKSLEEISISGHLDQASNQHVSGWAKAAATEEPVMLDVLVDGVAVATLTAENFRADLVEAGISQSGKHGFDFSLPKSAAPGSTIAVVEKNSNVNLIGSPVVVS